MRAATGNLYKPSLGTIHSYYNMKYNSPMPKLLDAQIGFLIDVNTEVWGWTRTERNVVLERVIRMMTKQMRPQKKVTQDEFADIEEDLRNLWKEVEIYPGPHIFYNT